jgi:YbbR domain-containing protein
MKIRWLTPGFWLADWKLRLAALVGALLLWGYVRQEQTITMTMTVPLELKSPPQTMRMVRRPPRTVEVRLQAQRAAAAALTAGSLRVVADLSGARGRKVSIPLTADDVQRPGGVSVLDISPSQLVLEFEPVGKEE